MKNFFLILGWGILLAVILFNRLAQPMSDIMVIVLSVIAAISLCTGILIKQKKSKTAEKRRGNMKILTRSFQG